jgi:hypothetical protein
MYSFVDNKNYHDEAMYCLSCGWEGLGHQLKESEVFPIIEIKEVYCPCCNRYMGQFEINQKEELV